MFRVHTIADETAHSTHRIGRPDHIDPSCPVCAEAIAARIGRPILADRPYILTFSNSGAAFPISADEARRLVANYPVVAMTSGRLTLRADDGARTFITPATLGGGPAFTRGAR